MYTLNIRIYTYHMKMILFYFGNEKSIWINFILFLNKIIIDSMRTRDGQSEILPRF